MRDPASPRRLGQFKTGGSGTHRNYYDGGRYVHLASGAPGYTGNIYQIVDIDDPRRPVEIARSANFCARGGRFGPHNQHQPQHQRVLLDRDDLVFLTYFNAGVRVVDISDARLLREVGWFVPPDPTTRIGTLPTKLVARSEDVLVDARGYIYLTDKNHGLYVLRYDGL